MLCFFVMVLVDIFPFSNLHLIKIILFFIKVFCHDSNALVLKVLSERGMDPHSSDVHVGIDGGQGILKLAITATDRKDAIKSSGGRSHYSEVF